LLAQLLADDVNRLPVELVDRIVGSVFSPALVADTQPMLSILAITRPELLRRYPELATEWTNPAFLYEVALAAPPGGPPELAELTTRLTKRLDHDLTTRSVHHGDVVPSMLRNLRFAPQQLGPVIKALQSYGPLAWRQVRPTEMLAAIDALDRRDVRQQLRALLEYFVCRRDDDFDDEEKAALAEIGRRVTID